MLVYARVDHSSKMEEMDDALKNGLPRGAVAARIGKLSSDFDAEVEGYEVK